MGERLSKPRLAPDVVWVSFPKSFTNVHNQFFERFRNLWQRCLHRVILIFRLIIQNFSIRPRIEYMFGVFPQCGIKYLHKVFVMTFLCIRIQNIISVMTSCVSAGMRIQRNVQRFNRLYHKWTLTMVKEQIYLQLQLSAPGLLYQTDPFSLAFVRTVSVL